MRKKNEDKKNINLIGRRIMPIGLLSRRLGDAFGNSVYLAESIDDTLGTLAWAADENLIEGVSAYDDDVAPWTADNRGRVVDQQDQMLLRKVQDFLEDNNLVLSSFGCDLTRDAMFRNGALTNPDEAIRQLALRKIERAAVMAKTLGTRNFRISIGREGYEEPLGVNWRTAFNTLAEGLNGVTRFINARSGFDAIELMTGYSRKLRGHLYMGSPMQAAFMMSQLNQPAFWRLCIESDDLSSMPAYSVLAATNSLAYMPFGGEDGWNWNAHISNIVAIIKMLGEFNWSGNAECLFAPLRTEADDKEREFTKRQFITNSMTALTLAVEQAKRLVNGWSEGLSPSESGLMAVTLCNGMDVDDVLRLTVSARDDVQAESGDNAQHRQSVKGKGTESRRQQEMSEPCSSAEKPEPAEKTAAVLSSAEAPSHPETSASAIEPMPVEVLPPAEPPMATENQPPASAEPLVSGELTAPVEEDTPQESQEDAQVADAPDNAEDAASDSGKAKSSGLRAKSRNYRRTDKVKGSRSVVKRRSSRYARKK
ncbi:MAG: hypothetical protein IJS15_08090 [Victivallales bacterium]|nr:hypothetical protein [Victivallales bacterium]